MSVAVSSLNWNISDPTNAIATVSCDFGASLEYVIDLSGAVQRSPANVVPKFLTVDNLANSGYVTVTIGPYVWRISAYQRETLSLPVNATSVFVDGTVGTAILYFSQTQANLPSSVDMLAVQKDALGVTKFPFTTYTAAYVAQITGDFAEQINCVPVGADMTYALLPIATQPVDNGAFLFLYNNGTKRVLVTPKGADTINTVFTVASPLILYPGDMGFLSCDGAQWFFTFWKREAVSVDITAAATTGTANDIGRLLRFSSTTIVCAYDLAAAANFDNGEGFAVDVTGTETAEIVPNGADTINGFWTAANPLTLRPGDHGRLFIDDSGQWRYSGSLTFESAEFSFARGATATLTHNLSVKPWQVELWLRCKNAEDGYNPGDEIPQDASYNSTYAYMPSALVASATQIVYGIEQFDNISLTVPTTGVRANVAYTGSAPTNFNGFIRARAKL